MKSLTSILILIFINNTGKRAGKETVDYPSDLNASQSTPGVKRLRMFKKISLEPGETKTVTFTLNRKDLAYFTPKGESLVEPGGFGVNGGRTKTEPGGDQPKNMKTTPIIKSKH